MRRPRQHEIDDEAQVVLRKLLPSSWVCGELGKDYGKDYLVELVEQGELTGKAFVVQLKGADRLRAIGEGSVVSFSMNVEHLIYYVDKVEVPVFLIVVDVSTEKAYWLFVQEHIDTSLAERRPGWREQTSTTLHLSVANDLSNSPSLRAAVDAALIYMKAKYPGRVEDAIAAAKQEMEEADPRFVVDVSVQGGKTIYTMHAKEDVQFLFSMKGDKEIIPTKCKEILHQGLLVDLADVNATLVGLPSVSEAERVVQIQFQRKLPIEVRIALLASDGAELRTLETIAGHAVGGIKEMRLSEPLGQSILIAQLTITCLDGTPPIRVDGTFGFDMGRWGGKRVSVLPYFEQVDALLQHLAEGGELRWRVSTQGNQLFDMRGRLPIDATVRQVSEYCRIFRAARSVSEWSGVDPVVPKTMSPDEVDDLFKLTDLLDPERRVVTYPGKELTLEMSRDAVRTELEGGNSPFGGTGQARVVSEPLRLNFLGVPVEVHDLVGDISAVKFQQTDEDMRRWLAETDEPIAHVTAISTPDATLTKTIGGVRQLHNMR